MRTSILVSLMAVVSSFAFADELVLTSSSGKSATAMAIDYVSDGAASGVQINLSLQGASEKNVDLSKLKVVSGDFELVSSVHGTEVVILISSPSNSTLPKGLLTLGNIALRGGTVTLKEIIAVNSKAEVINTKSRAQ